MDIGMSGWVALSARFTPGWPWPEQSFGLDPMFGADGWCNSCGTPKGPQSGCLIMQGRKFPDAPVWTPNWLFDVVCVSLELGEEISERFDVELREVRKPRGGGAWAKQLIPSTTPGTWYDATDLDSAVIAQHAQHNGTQTGAQCSSCQTWRWLPITEGAAPVRSHALIDAKTDVIASPEVFGDGLASHRHLLFRRPLGEFLASAHPSVWTIVEINLAPEY